MPSSLMPSMLDCRSSLIHKCLYWNTLTTMCVEELYRPAERCANSSRLTKIKALEFGKPVLKEQLFSPDRPIPMFTHDNVGDPLAF